MAEATYERDYNNYILFRFCSGCCQFIILTAIIILKVIVISVVM